MMFLSNLQAAASQVSQTDLNESFRLQEAPQAWIIVLLIVPALFLVAWLSYRREAIPSGARAMLAFLRFGALLVLSLVLCRPVMIERREEVHPAEVVILVDDSASMQRSEAYNGDVEARKAVTALTLGQDVETMRLELAKSVLNKRVLPILSERGYDVSMYRFSESAAPMLDSEQLSGAGHVTNLGDSLAQVLATHRGQSTTDLLVISDGRSNGGIPALDAARSASSSGIQVHSVVIGDTRPELNAVVELIEAPQSALEGDELAITVRITGRGIEEETVQVVLEEFTGEGDLTRTIAESLVPLSERGERVVLVAPPGRAIYGKDKRRFRVFVPPLPGETLLDDNERELTVPVSPEKIRVLYVEGYPRWEYRRLALDLLKRADENIEFQCYLLSATPNFPQESSDSLPALKEIPTGRRELLDNYDVIILGDINPSEVSTDPERAKEFIESLREFVKGGGGLLFQSGEFDNPRTFVLNNTLRELLPVMLDASTVHGFEGDTRTPFHATLEDPANPHEIVRLHSDLAVNRSLWEDEGGLAGFYWYSPVTRAKPGSQVLLRHPTDVATNQERYPLLVAGYYPAGRTLFMGVDSTWRWYWRFGKRYHERYWRNAIRWLALGRLRSGDRRYRIEVPRSNFDLDERIVIEGRALDEDYRPSSRPELDAVWTGPEGDEHELKLSAVPGRAGLFRASFQPERPGAHEARIVVDSESVSNTEFEVVLPSRENSNPAPDPETLAALASMTGGVSVDITNIDELLEQFPGGEERREPISSRLRDAWDNWTTMLIALFLLSLEWILRKRYELV
ncbi:MAG: putative membrane protein [Planctomycetota bacterium]|jgi:uncharacterized membrane protein